MRLAEYTDCTLRVPMYCAARPQQLLITSERRQGRSIARRNVEADGGTLTVQDKQGSGCVFTMSLPQHQLLHMVVEG